MQKKKILMLLFAILVISQLFIVSFAEPVLDTTNDIKIIVNGNIVQSDAAAFISNDRTMVPFRAIFQALGATVSWDSSTKIVTGIKGDITIKLVIGSKTVLVNGKEVKLEVAALIKDGRTFVPLRFIAESLGASVSWDGGSKTVTVEYLKDSATSTPQSSTSAQPSPDSTILDESKELVTSNYKNEYLRVKIENNSCTLSGKVKDVVNKKYLMININNTTDGTTLVKSDTELNSLGEFSVKLDLSKLVNNSNYAVFIYTCSQKYSKTYIGWIYDEDVVVKKEAGELSIKIPKTYDLNKTNHLFGIKNPSEYLKPEEYIESNSQEIKNLAATLISGKTADLEKVLSIHDWVADNIYYDYDSYYSGNITWEQTSALTVLKTKKSVCQGYASLFEALCRASNIPCYIESGFALGISQKGSNWENIDLTTVKSNHAWNVVYINGKWILVDSTWDSGNEYIDGKFNYVGLRGYKYFDPSMYLFSNSHYIIHE